MSKPFWDETSAEFAQNFALASTGLHHTHTPDVSIEPVEGGVYQLSIDKECIHLTAQDLLDIMEWGLLHARELEAEAKAALRADMAAKGFPVEDEDTRTYMEHHYTGGE